MLAHIITTARYVALYFKQNLTRVNFNLTLAIFLLHFDRVEPQAIWILSRQKEEKIQSYQINVTEYSFQHNSELG